MLIVKKGLIVSLSVWITSLSINTTATEPRTKLLANINPILLDSATSGKQLAIEYCQRCHLFPEPVLLDKKTWISSVLPNMGQRLGLKFQGLDPLEDLLPEEEKLIRELNIYPETAAISKEDWEKIVKYYEQEAPEEPLPQKKTAEIADHLPLFKVQEISIGDKPFPQTTLLKFNKASSSLYVGDAQNSLYVLDSSFQLKDTWWIDTPPTDIDFPKNAMPRLLTIGIFKPSEQKLGRLMSLNKISNPTSDVNIQTLPRPVQFASGDINTDGKEDVVISGFGNHSGKLLWLDNFQPEKEHVLKALPGARKVEITDFNKDKKPDIIALTAQAREEVSIFYNLGNGKFREKILLQFPPSYGMSYFEIVDFNKDGFQDILVTNGDNWDLSPIQKNYHGVRLYLNDKKDNFKEVFFYPLHGASKAVARDFDNDGDIDIAAASFYSDLKNPAHGFIYLQNEGQQDFKPFSTPEAASGKWLTMEAADIDQDGDLDIVLGSYFHTLNEMTQLVFKGVLSFPQLLVLKNQTK
ncbi:VCBS repeat-containing protein [Dyadobacter sp. CY312]|uniref:FG-GAP repeat domain-containing protein n=1 Tax=Dyadobacter sp. CY312 TaxID=2907303 RepID=UPI001F226E5A|nr:VCBS repeat-containing protein [Dyadobacter sp. CY312]MCE7043563.1 VCBS repeat-containing protein [Dyadobacter sp. CY312]